MSIDVQPTSPTVRPSVLDATALVHLESREFYRHMGEINTAHAEAEAAYQTATDNLLVLLTEQVARVVQAAHPAAAMVFVRTAAEFHADEDGNQSVDCEGHNHRLVPFEVLDDEGVVLSGFDLLSPVMFLMERLSPLLGLENQVLDIETREWALDCTED